MFSAVPAELLPPTMEVIILSTRTKSWPSIEKEALMFTAWRKDLFRVVHLIDT